MPSRGFLVESDNVPQYNSEQEVKDYIDSTVQKQAIRKHSLIEFKYRDSAQLNGETIYDDELSSLVVYSHTSIPEGKIIESINIPINKNTRIFNGEDILFTENSIYSNFKNIISTWNISDDVKNHILDQINTPEKISIFIYKVNEILEENRDNSKKIDDIVNEIENAGKQYYYIESKTWESHRNIHRYKVIPTNPIIIENYKKSKRIPAITLMSAIAQTLQDKFNVKVNLNTSDLQY